MGKVLVIVAARTTHFWTLELNQQQQQHQHISINATDTQGFHQRLIIRFMTTLPLGVEESKEADRWTGDFHKSQCVSGFQCQRINIEALVGW